jgi:DNA-binding MarR family transcriptional regulator
MTSNGADRTPTASTADQGDLPARLRLAVVRTARRLRQHAGTGLSPSLTAALATVESCGPLTPSELADREAIKRPAATRIVARLEAEGLVDRTADPADGRVTLIATTAAGRDLLRRVRKRKNEYLARRMRDLPEEDLAALARAADVLERLLEGDRPSGDRK